MVQLKMKLDNADVIARGALECRVCNFFANHIHIYISSDVRDSNWSTVLYGTYMCDAGLSQLLHWNRMVPCCMRY